MNGERFLFSFALQTCECVAYLALSLLWFLTKWCLGLYHVSEFMCGDHRSLSRGVIDKG